MIALQWLMYVFVLFADHRTRTGQLSEHDDRRTLRRVRGTGVPQPHKRRTYQPQGIPQVTEP